ncbi:MAG: hypothetical protein J5643_11610 [Lachnospiraceae bacterium]|nr:hypothetical protein [Lachnospiraceae bacterium]
MIDMTDAEFVNLGPQIQLDRVELEILDEKSDNSIYNVIIQEIEKDASNGQ